MQSTYKELEVALSICSSSCEEDANHPDIILGELHGESGGRRSTQGKVVLRARVVMW
jgi:hypothetical protein